MKNIDNGFLIWDGRNHPATALAQHHGIPTSLLDWTNKPMVAALFAAEDVALVTKVLCKRAKSDTRGVRF
jgi:hypothetical protein